MPNDLPGTAQTQLESRVPSSPLKQDKNGGCCSGKCQAPSMGLLSLLLGKHPRNDQLLETVLFKNVKVQFRPGFLETSAGM